MNGIKPVFLLVEDNRDEVVLALRALEKSGIQAEIAVARDGEEALQFLFATGAHAGRRSSDTPRLILLDWKLPKLSAFEVLRQVRADQRTSRLPVVILTSSCEECDIAEAYGLSVNSYIRKPIDFLEFTSILQQLITYWLVLNTPAPALATDP